jgi:TonB family protein
VKRRDPRRVLAIAIALSLLLHAVIATVLRPARPASQNDVERVTIEHRSAIALQTPPPKPRRTPAPRPRPSVIPAKAEPTPGRQALPGAPSVRGTAAPQPTPTPTPAEAAPAVTPPRCNGNDIGAATIGEQPQPDIPAAAIAVVAVRLNASGGVLSASVAQSTGNSSLDLVAVTMARSARYRPATHDCNAVASTYRYSVRFVAW